MALLDVTKKPTAAAKTSRPVTIKHLAATLAEEHQLTKRASEALLGDLVSMIPKHPRRANEWHRGPRDPTSQKARSPHGTESRNWRSDQDQSKQESRIPGGQGFEDGDLGDKGSS